MENYNIETPVPLEFEDILKAILGNINYELPNNFEYLSEKDFRECINKLLNVVLYSAECTLTDADNLLKSEISETIMVSVQILKQQKNINQISTFTIATLSRVLFLLMGRVPENTNSKISKRKKYTK